MCSILDNDHVIDRHRNENQSRKCRRAATYHQKKVIPLLRHKNTFLRSTATVRQIELMPKKPAPTTAVSRVLLPLPACGKRVEGRGKPQSIRYFVIFKCALFDVLAANQFLDVVAFVQNSDARRP